MSDTCEHGGLRLACLICELTAERDEAIARAERIETVLAFCDDGPAVAAQRILRAEAERDEAVARAERAEAERADLKEYWLRVAEAVDVVPARHNWVVRAAVLAHVRHVAHEARQYRERQAQTCGTCALQGECRYGWHTSDWYCAAWRAKEARP